MRPGSKQRRSKRRGESDRRRRRRRLLRLGNKARPSSAARNLSLGA